jgi:hypothetical protein
MSKGNGEGQVPTDQELAAKPRGDIIDEAHRKMLRRIFAERSVGGVLALIDEILLDRCNMGNLQPNKDEMKWRELARVNEDFHALAKRLGL